jgi:hypothetical protein
LTPFAKRWPTAPREIAVLSLNDVAVKSIGEFPQQFNGRQWPQ